MFEKRERGITALLAITQGGLAVLLLKGVNLLSVDGWGELTSQWITPLGWAWLVGIGAELLWRDGREGQGFGMGTFCLSRCLQRSVVAVAVSLAAGYRFSPLGMDPGKAFLFHGLYFALLLSTHWYLPGILVQFFFPDRHQHRVLMVGDPLKVDHLSHVLKSQSSLGYRSVGRILRKDGLHGESIAPCQESARELAQIVRERSVDHIVLTGSLKETHVSGWKEECEKLGVRLVVAQHFGASESERFLWEAQGEWGFGLACREPLQSPLNRSLKRALDILVSIPALVFGVLPLALLVGLVQRRQSPGAVFYRQWRHGRGNCPFKVWKFRTMHPEVKNVSSQAKRDDPRIYPFASWLRQHSLDELPQFWNVLIGEMSVVGPRPHFIEHTETFESQRRYHVRSFVKPGITGLAQVNGCRGEVRTSADMERRVAFDIKYVEGWSLWLDLKLIATTAKQVVFPPSTAY